MSQPVTPEWVRRLPKVELHLHLDGAVRTATLLALAREQGAPLPARTEDELRPLVTAGPGCRSLAGFLRVFETFYPLLRSPAAVERIARELCAFQARAGVAYFEARFAPVLLASERGGVPELVDAALRGLEQGAAASGVRAGLVLCCYRTEDPASSLATVEAAAAFRARGVCGIDLAGEETRHPGLPHVAAFARARELGLPVTVHAGEVAGPSSVQEALFLLGARRIGHGVRLGEDPALLRHVIERRVPLEVCLTSNRRTGAWTDIPAHPAAGYFRSGAAVTLSTDDPAVCRTDLNDELLLASRAFGWGREELLRLQHNAVEAAFLPEDGKEALRRALGDAAHDDR